MSLPRAIAFLMPTHSIWAKCSWLPVSTCKSQAAHTGYGSCHNRKYISILKVWAESHIMLSTTVDDIQRNSFSTLFSSLSVSTIPDSRLWFSTTLILCCSLVQISPWFQCFTLWPDSCHYPDYLCTCLDSGFDYLVLTHSLVPTLPGNSQTAHLV